MTSLTLTIVSRSLFGTDVSHVRSAVSNAAMAVQDFFASFRKHYVTIPHTSPRRPTSDSIAPWPNSTRWFIAVIASRRASGERGADVVSVLIDAKGEDGHP